MKPYWELPPARLSPLIVLVGRGKGEMADRTIDWRGRSGKTYRYWIYDIGTQFTANEAGNYVFARESPANTFTEIYVGQTGDLSERFEFHHKMPCIRQKGATHITVHTNNAGEAVRRAEEADLIAYRKPACND